MSEQPLVIIKIRLQALNQSRVDEKMIWLFFVMLQVLAKGLQKRISNRYQSVDELATDLYGCLVRVERLNSNRRSNILSNFC